MNAVAETELVALQKALYSSRNPTRRWLHCSRRDWIVTTLRTIGGPVRDAALEVGPGSGVYLPTLTEIYGRVVATDVENAYLNHLRPLASRYHNLNLIEDDITRSSLPPASFDVVLCTEVLEHLRDSQRALHEIRRLLKPNGLLVVSTPQRYSPLELTCKVAFLPLVIDIVRHIYREPILETGHINLMTAGEMSRQLKTAGFVVEASHTSGMYLPLVAEFGGKFGLAIEQWLEGKLRGGLAGGLLWTQYYVARA